MESSLNNIRGRGASTDQQNRFREEKIDYFEDQETGEKPNPAREIIWDDSSTIITKNSSPDIGFTHGINVYRGCEHGCAYCYARPYHEFLGYSPGLEFESKIVVKRKAPELLRKALSSPRWQPKVLAMSGVTDCYQPLERELALTRQCLKVLEEFRNPVTIITKNHLVTRDVDLLGQLAESKSCRVYLSLTTNDRSLARTLEPRTSTPDRRLKAIRTLSDAGIPVGVMVAPIIPGLNDHEVVELLEAAADAGATMAGYTMLRLPYAVKDIFSDWLEHHRPDRKDKVLNRIKELRGGKLNSTEFGTRMKGEGTWSEQIGTLFRIHARRLGLNRSPEPLSTASFRPGRGSQLGLF